MDINELIAENERLKDSLEIILKAEKNQAKFETDKLKNDIARSIGRMYKDFLELKELERLEEDAEIFMDILTNVFIALEKLGVEFNY